jgi:hypothetical protein
MIIRLKNNIPVEVNGKSENDFNYTVCRGCSKSILWAKTTKGKLMPISQMRDCSWVSHFFDCPNAKNFRKSK